MKSFLSRVVFLTVLVFTGTASAHELPDALGKVLKKHRIATSQVSLWVQPMDGGDAILQLNPDTPRNPASAIKLLTTLAALELLGPGYQWQTTYLAGGGVTDGVINGDLIFKGGGDPFLTVEKLLEHLFALRQRGVKKIAGDLVIDNSFFKTDPHDRDDFDGKPQRLYNVGPDAALTNFAVTNFFIAPAADGTLTVRAEPPLAGVTVVNKIKARGGDCRSSKSGWSYRVARADATASESGASGVTVTFAGDYRRACGEHTFARSLFAADEYTARLIVALWRALGGEVGDGWRVAAAPDDAKIILTRPSEPLADIITGINKFSNNVMSRQLLLTIAAAAVGDDADDDDGDDDDDGTDDGATVADGDSATVADGSNRRRGEAPTALVGITAIHNWLAENHIAMPALVMENGAGLSRKSRATAGGLWAVLRRGWHGDYAPEFVSSLPLAAIDGTLRTRLPDSPLAGRARIKTGLIDGVRSMAGFVRARDGTHYGVVLLAASPRVTYHNGNAMQDALLRWVYER